MNVANDEIAFCIGWSRAIYSDPHCCQNSDGFTAAKALVFPSITGEKNESISPHVFQRINNNKFTVHKYAEYVCFD